MNAPVNSNAWKKLLLILFVCAAPTIAAYIVYYFFPPTTRTNYGDLIQPQRPMPSLNLSSLDGKSVALSELKGKWLMVMINRADCDQACNQKLYQLRQVRLTSGKERERVARIWLISDAAPLSTMLMGEYQGTHLLRVDPQSLQAWLPTTSATTLQDHIYLIDPLGNLMLRWPKDADATGMKKDLSKVLRASRIG